MLLHFLDITKMPTKEKSRRTNFVENLRRQNKPLLRVQLLKNPIRVDIQKFEITEKYNDMITIKNEEGTTSIRSYEVNVFPKIDDELSDADPRYLLFKPVYTVSEENLPFVISTLITLTLKKNKFLKKAIEERFLVTRELPKDSLINTTVRFLESKEQSLQEKPLRIELLTVQGKVKVKVFRKELRGNSHSVSYPNLKRGFLGSKKADSTAEMVAILDSFIENVKEYWYLQSVIIPYDMAIIQKELDRIEPNDFYETLY